MGISIHYKGEFNDATKLAEFVNEVADISEVNKWKFKKFSHTFEQGTFTAFSPSSDIYGIVFSPADCEPVMLTFTCDGRMCNPWYFEMVRDSHDPEQYEAMRMLSTKTHYAGFETHCRVVDLLKYISAKYFNNFKVIDETSYYETSDAIKGKQAFDASDTLISTMAKKLQNNFHGESEDGVV
ncbi:MAG: hypothetical protein IPH66_09080 [Crocinitomicaceae bacterium]|nr:hypothetical protein [Crocinitomicaceae bacterium]